MHQYFKMLICSLRSNCDSYYFLFVLNHMKVFEYGLFFCRLHNKGVYVKMGLRKMVSRKLCKDLHRLIRLEVDGKHVELPPLEGIIILNILSWGSGANPWGPEKEDQFNKPNHWDGALEVVGVSGVVHLGQIQSGLRSAMRIAQGGQFTNLNIMIIIGNLSIFIVVYKRINQNSDRCLLKPPKIVELNNIKLGSTKK